jgi:hypothetical protein
MRLPTRLKRAVTPPAIGPDTLVLERHRAFIRALPCVACGTPAPSECATVREVPGDRYTVPLCGPPTVWQDCCHSRLYYHGRPRFWSELGIDPLALATRLWRVSGDRKAGQRVVMCARQAIAINRPQCGSPCSQVERGEAGP